MHWRFKQLSITRLNETMLENVIHFCKQLVGAVLCLHACKFLPHFAFKDIHIPLAVPSPPAKAKEGVILLVDLVSFPIFAANEVPSMRQLAACMTSPRVRGWLAPMPYYYGVECYFRWKYN